MGVAVFAGQSADKELGVFRWQLPSGTNWVLIGVMRRMAQSSPGRQ
jgi:hypothetical protein